FPNTTYGLVTQFTLTRALSLNLALNTHSVAVGDVVQVSISPVNPGAAEVVDVYFAILLPAASGPSLGCPNGDAAAFFGNALSTVVDLRFGASGDLPDSVSELIDTGGPGRDRGQQLL